HFNGPLSLRPSMESAVLHVPISYADDSQERRRWYAEHPPTYEERQLVRGDTSSVYAQVGTPGLGRGTFAALSARSIPQAAHPVAEIEFAARDTGKPLPVARVVLRERCCGTLFHGSLRVPEEAALGRATVSLSLAAGRAGPVAPATGPVLVAD